MFKKILIANRGEIALRVIRAAASSASARSPSTPRSTPARCTCASPTKRCASARAGRRSSYLNIPPIISRRRDHRRRRDSPGYGFLSENAEFAELCEKCGVTFIGPTPEAMRAWGDKVTRARRTRRRFGLPLLPGTGVLRDADARARARRERIGFPVILKASGGGGGRGMRIVRSEAEVARAFETAPRRGEAGFKNPDVYLERFVEDARGTSSSRSSPISTAACGRSASASARCSAATRR